MRKCLITGSNGFIGSYLLKELKKRSDIEIKTLQRSEHDLFNKKVLEDSVKDCDLIFHLAGISSKKRSPGDLLKANVLGTLNLLEAIKDKNIKLIFASSFNCYPAKQSKEPLKENDELQPINFYGLTKKHAEEIISNYGVEGIIFRFSNVFGPGLKPNSTSVISTLSYKALNKEEITIFGDGEQTKDFIYVEDVAETLIKCLDTEIQGLNTYNLCSGNSYSLNQILRMIEKNTSNKINRVYKGNITTFYQIGDNTKIKKLFDFKARYSFEEGIKKVIEYFQNDKN